MLAGENFDEFNYLGANSLFQINTETKASVILREKILAKTYAESSAQNFELLC